MKIAVCIFGQPRFYKESAESFRKEFFDMPNHEVDVFIHCWDEVGYTPSDDIDQTNEKKINQELKDDIWNLYGGNDGRLKHMVVESPEENFNKIADSLGKVINQVRDDKYYQDQDWRKEIGRKKLKATPDSMSDLSSLRISGGKVLRYEMGQFYSIGKSLELKAWYEKENNIKYDLVIRTRFDSFYIPKELYSGNLENYYEEKETYYGALHKYYGGIGLMGHGLKMVCGIGNGAHSPDGREDTGYFTDLEYIDFKNSQIIEIKNAPHEKRPMIMDNLIDSNGMFSFPWKLHLKDWMLMADSDTSDRVWGGMLSVYITYITNDLIRFIGGKQCGFMPGGEVLNGFSGLIGNAKVIQIPDYVEDEYVGKSKSSTRCRWKGQDLESNKRRVLKIVNKNIHKRKDPFKPKKGEQDWQIPYGGGSVPCGTHEQMVKAMIDFASSDRDKNNPISKTYKKNK